MEKKEVLRKLNNQSFKSLKRLEKQFSFSKSFLKVKIEHFNSDYLKIISAVLNNETYALSLTNNLVYIHATINEKNELRILIDSVPTNN